MKDLGTLAGDIDSQAIAVNANGQVVGLSGQINSQSFLWHTNAHGFLFTLDPNGTVISRVTLDALPGSSFSVPYSINNAGQVVGAAYVGAGFRYYDPSGQQSSRPARALLWDGLHRLHDLNSVIPSGSGWVLTEAWAINNAGQIVGTGINPSGQTHAFLVAPMPAPLLSLASSQPNGQFRFTLLGEPGRTYTIQASTNLVTWTTLTNFVSTTGTNQFADATASNLSQRFYRALSP